MSETRTLLGLTVLLVGFTSPAGAAEVRELKVHLAQANNDSPYAFVRAKFDPGEVPDPWAVRFFDEDANEVPSFVWDSVTWRTAREGRADWGRRFALLNHGPGDAPEVTAARGTKLRAAEQALPELAAEIEAREQAAGRAPDSVCAAMYLLRYRVPAFGKKRLTLRIDPANRTGFRLFVRGVADADQFQLLFLDAIAGEGWLPGPALPARFRDACRDADPVIPAGVPMVATASFS